MSSKGNAGSGLPSIDDQINAIGFGRFQVVALTTFVLFIISDGMELVTTNVIWRALPREEWGMTEDVRGILVSLSYFGFVIGAIIGGVVGDSFGRKAILYAHAVLFLPVSIFSAFSQNQYQLIVTRFFVGISMGFVLPTAVSLMTEFSTSAERAKTVLAIPGLSFCGGQTIILGVGLWLMTVYGIDCKDCEWWRGMLLAGVVPDLIAVVLVIMYIPESPRFLLYQNKREELEETITYIAKMNGAEDKLLEGGKVRMLDTSEAQGDGGKQFAELFQPPLQGLLILLIFIWSMLGTGLYIQAMTYPLVLENTTDISLFEQYWFLMYAAFAEIPGIALAMMIVDHPSFGRRLSIAFFIAMSIIASAITIVCLAIGGLWPIHLANMLLRFTVTVPYELMYVYVSEMLPTSHRNQGLSFGNGTTKLMGVLVPLILFPTIAYNPSIPFFVLIATSSLGLVFLLWLGKEPTEFLQDVVSQTAELEKQRAAEQSPLLKTEKAVV